MGSVVFDKLVEKIISVLKTSANVTRHCGSGSAARIYGAHLSTIQDWVLPAVSIHILPGMRRDVTAAAFDFVNLQIEPWFHATGKHGNVWDDVMECHAGIVGTLHRCGVWDDTIAVKILEMTMIARGPQIQDPDGIMHYPSRWRVRATV